MQRTLDTVGSIIDAMSTGEIIESDAYRHGVLETYHILLDGEDYVFSVHVNTNEGVEDSRVSLRPAKKIVTTTWVAK